MRCHTGERPYQCPHCTYASPDMYKLKRHLRIHTGEKPYECDVCQARFTQSNSLKAHKLIHSGNKPSFHCDFCPTTCGRKTDLRIHMQKLHTSDKPLKCKRCGKTFPDRYSYKVRKENCVFLSCVISRVIVYNLSVHFKQFINSCIIFSLFFLPKNAKTKVGGGKKKEPFFIVIDLE
ncbi:unnamed protein product [Larinioides sclopetarius]